MCARPPQVLPMGTVLSDHVSQPNNAQGIYCPLLAVILYCSVSTPRTKWLRIDCSNLFILRWGGSVSRPKITLKSDYIKFLTPATNNFCLGSQTLSVRWCVSVNVNMNVMWECVHLYVCLWRLCAFDYIYGCMHFRKRSCKPAWNCWGISWATIKTILKTFPAVLKYTTELPTQALLYSPLNSCRPSSLPRRCVCVLVWPNHMTLL